MRYKEDIIIEKSANASDKGAVSVRALAHVQVSYTRRLKQVLPVEVSRIDGEDVATLARAVDVYSAHESEIHLDLGFVLPDEVDKRARQCEILCLEAASKALEEGPAYVHAVSIKFISAQFNSTGAAPASEEAGTDLLAEMSARVLEIYNRAAK